jgi:Fe-S-cluster-containing dehydrogenase component
LGQWGIRVLEDGPWPLDKRDLRADKFYAATEENKAEAIEIEGALQHGKMHWTYLPEPTELCNLCSELVAKGEVPRCVQTCQARVMEYGSVQDMAKKADAIGSKVVIFLPGIV